MCGLWAKVEAVAARGQMVDEEQKYMVSTGVELFSSTEE